MIGLIIIVIFAFIGPVINKHDYAEQNVEHKKKSSGKNTCIRQSSILFTF